MEQNTPDPLKVLIGASLVLIPNEDGSGSRSVEVRELRWASALQFIQMLAEHVAGATKPDEQGRPVFNLDRVKELVPGTAALAQFLVERTTGLKPAEIECLPTSAFLEILAVAMEKNLSEDLVGKFQRVAGVVTRTFGASTPAFPGPSTS